MKPMIHHTIMIVDRETGDAVAEVGKRLTPKVNRSRYDVMTPYDYLTQLNARVKAESKR